jgi:hypothetical protein
MIGRMKTRTQNNGRRTNPCRGKTQRAKANGELPKKAESNLYDAVDAALEPKN